MYVHIVFLGGKEFGVTSTYVKGSGLYALCSPVTALPTSINPLFKVLQKDDPSPPRIKWLNSERLFSEFRVHPYQLLSRTGW